MSFLTHSLTSRSLLSYSRSPSMSVLTYSLTHSRYLCLSLSHSLPHSLSVSLSVSLSRSRSAAPSRARTHTLSRSSLRLGCVKEWCQETTACNWLSRSPLRISQLRGVFLFFLFFLGHRISRSRHPPDIVIKRCKISSSSLSQSATNSETFKNENGLPPIALPPPATVRNKFWKNSALVYLLCEVSILMTSLLCEVAILMTWDAFCGALLTMWSQHIQVNTSRTYEGFCRIMTLPPLSAPNSENNNIAVF